MAAGHGSSGSCRGPRRLATAARHVLLSSDASDAISAGAEPRQQPELAPDWSGTDDGASGMTPLPIDEGGVSAATLQQLAERRDTSAARHDYRTAASLQDLITVLTPRALTLADFSPPSLEDQIRCFYEHGMVILQGAFQGEELRRLQSAFLAKEHPARQAWESRQAAAAAALGPSGASEGEETAGFRFPPEAEQTFSFGFDYLEPTFASVLEHPALLPFFRRVCSTGDDTRTASAGGGLRLVQASGLVLTPDPPGTAGYISWHRDKPRPDGWPFPRPRVVKVFIYPFGVRSTEGPTTLVRAWLPHCTTIVASSPFLLLSPTTR